MKFKRFMSMLLVVMLLTTIVPFSVFAEENEYGGMPVVNITGIDSLAGITKETKTKVSITYTDGVSDFTHFATLKLQGSSSLNYAKKNFSVALFEDAECKTKCPVDLGRGWGAQNKYCLKANAVDVSQARNVVSAQIFSDIVESRGINDEISAAPNNGVTDGYPVVVCLNGEFYGLYTLNIPKDQWMYGMNGEGHQAVLFGDSWKSSAGLFSEIADSDGDGSIDVSEIENSGWDLEYCSTEDTEDGVAWVGESMNNFINFLNNNAGASLKAGIGQYTDVNRAIDHFLYTYFLNAADNRAKNIAWVTYDGQHWIPSMYDMDDTWGMRYDGVFDDPFYAPDSADMVPQGTNMLFYRLLENYMPELKARFTELTTGDGALTQANIEAKFDEFLNSIPDSVRTLESNKWGASLAAANPPIANADENNIAQISEFAEGKIAFLNNYFNTQEADTEPSLLQVFVETPNSINDYELLETKSVVGGVTPENIMAVARGSGYDDYVCPFVTGDHVHTNNCHDEIICGIEGHEHVNGTCYPLSCTIEPHQHTDACEELICTQKEHTHDSNCIACTHNHSVNCYTSERKGAPVSAIVNRAETLGVESGYLYHIKYTLDYYYLYFDGAYYNVGEAYFNKNAVTKVGESSFKPAIGSRETQEKWTVNVPSCTHKSHDDSCYTCGFPAKYEHSHIDTCYGITCGKTEHTHTDACYDKRTTICGKTEHVHNDTCYGLGCGHIDHKHTATCLFYTPGTEYNTVTSENGITKVYLERKEFKATFKDTNGNELGTVTAKWGADISEDVPKLPDGQVWHVVANTGEVYNNPDKDTNLKTVTKMPNHNETYVAVAAPASYTVTYKSGPKTVGEQTMYVNTWDNAKTMSDMSYTVKFVDTKDNSTLSKTKGTATFLGWDDNYAYYDRSGGTHTTSETTLQQNFKGMFYFNHATDVQWQYCATDVNNAFFVKNPHGASTDAMQEMTFYEGNFGYDRLFVANHYYIEGGRTQYERFVNNDNPSPWWDIYRPSDDNMSNSENFIPSGFPVRNLSHPNGGVDVTLTARWNYSAAATLPAKPTAPEGYHFIGWFTNPEGKGDPIDLAGTVNGSVIENDIIVGGTFTPATRGTTTLYACYDTDNLSLNNVSYTVIYQDENGKEISHETQSAGATNWYQLPETIDYTVSFDPDGGSNSPEDATAKINLKGWEDLNPIIDRRGFEHTSDEFDPAYILHHRVDIVFNQSSDGNTEGKNDNCRKVFFEEGNADLAAYGKSDVYRYDTTVDGKEYIGLQRIIDENTPNVIKQGYVGYDKFYLANQYFADPNGGEDQWNSYDPSDPEDYNWIYEPYNSNGERDLYLPGAYVRNLSSTNGAELILTAISDDTNAPIILPTPGTREGYVFDGWYDGDTNVGGIGDSYMPKGSAALVAKWVKETQDVVIAFNGPVSFNFSVDVASVSGKDGKDPLYGTVEVSSDNKKTIIYTPTKIAQGADELIVTYVSGKTTTVKVLPAEAIYYEDNFSMNKEGGISYIDGTKHAWNAVNDKKNPGSVTVTEDGKAVVPEGYNSGYTYSMGNVHWVTVDADDIDDPFATFTFTGTGFDVISLTSDKCGAVRVSVTNPDGTAYKYTNANGKLVTFKPRVVNNYYGYEYGGDVTYNVCKWTWNEDEGKWSARTEKGLTALPEDYETHKDSKNADNYFYTYSTNGKWNPISAQGTGANALYQIPVIEIRMPEFGTYKVTIEPVYDEYMDYTGNDSYDFYLDAIRIYSACQETAANVFYHELRDLLLDSKTVSGSTVSIPGVSFIDGTLSLEGIGSILADYEEAGPNNEVYLKPGQAIAFKLTEENVKSAELGMKAIGGAVDVMIAYGSDSEATKLAEVKTASELFYLIENCVGQDITIMNGNTTGDSILSLTRFKITTDGTGSDSGESNDIPTPKTNNLNAQNGMMALGAMIKASAPAPKPFEPTMSIEAPETATVGDKITVNVTTSENVAFIEVNGVKVEENDNFIWTCELDAAAEGTMDIEVVAYNVRGVAAEATATASVTVEAVPVVPEEPDVPDVPDEPDEPDEPDQPSFIDKITDAISSVVNTVISFFGKLFGIK